MQLKGHALLRIGGVVVVHALAGEHATTRQRAEKIALAATRVHNHHAADPEQRVALEPPPAPSPAGIAEAGNSGGVPRQ